MTHPTKNWGFWKSEKNTATVSAILGVGGEPGCWGLSVLQFLDRRVHRLWAATSS